MSLWCKGTCKCSGLGQVLLILVEIRCQISSIYFVCPSHVFKSKENEAFTNSTSGNVFGVPNRKVQKFTKIIRD
jgi:hypothetical protein